MSLGMLLIVFLPALIAALLYRHRLTQTPPAFDRVTITSASISPIEAAFIREGSTGLAQLGRAADMCGRSPGGSLDPEVVEDGLARRGFAHAREAKLQLARARSIVIAVAIALTAIAALANAVAIDLGAFLVFALVAVAMVTYLAPGTARGRRALAMRRAAYPLRSLAESEPLEAVALYGGKIRLRRDARGFAHAHAQVVGPDADFMWIGDAGGGSVDCSGGGHSGDCGSH